MSIPNMEDLELVSKSDLSRRVSVQKENCSCFKVSFSLGVKDEIFVLKKDASQVFYSYCEFLYVYVEGQNGECLECKPENRSMYIDGPRFWLKGKKEMTIAKALDKRREFENMDSVKEIQGEVRALKIIELMSLSGWEKLESKEV